MDKGIVDCYIDHKKRGTAKAESGAGGQGSSFNRKHRQHGKGCTIKGPLLPP